MRFGSVCSGIEAASTAFSLALGWEAQWFSEIEAFPSFLLAARYPGVKNLGDMTKIYDDATFKSTTLDALCGGTPCQSFSIAGLRKGLDDARGNLSLLFCKLAHIKKPSWILWENVPGVLSEKGNAFGCILAGLSGADAPLLPGTKNGKWAKSGIVPPKCKDGYGLAWRVLDAQYFGVPQRRRRVFVIGYLGDWRPAAEVLFEPQSMCGDSEKGSQAGQSVAGTLTGGARKNGGLSTDDVPLVPAGPIAFNWQENHCFKASSENTNLLRVQQTEAICLPIAFKIRQCCEGGGKGYLGSEDKTFTIATHQDQNVFVPGLSNALTAGGSTAASHGKKSGVDQETIIVQKAMRMVAFGEYADDDTASALKRRDYKDATDLIVPESHPLVLDDQGGSVMNASQNGKVGTLRSQSKGHEPLVLPETASSVRRLTPMECERLQGFPDGYTKIVVKTLKQKPRTKHFKNNPDLYRENADGTWSVYVADGPRYKALGNSWAVPCVQWIGRRMQAVHERIMMGDL